jgi:hypothetical protein
MTLSSAFILLGTDVQEVRSSSALGALVAGDEGGLGVRVRHKTEGGGEGDLVQVLTSVGMGGGGRRRQGQWSAAAGFGSYSIGREREVKGD